LQHEKQNQTPMQTYTLPPEGTCGIYAIEKFAVSKHDAELGVISSLINGRSRMVPEGTYTRLIRNGITTVMSDTPDEINDCREAIRHAVGSVLIAGLGLGVILSRILVKKNISTITVIELCPDIIRLVAPSFNDERLTITEGDIFEWRPPRGTYYDYVWFDIWDNIAADNLQEMNELKKIYRRRTNKMGFWCEQEARTEKRKIQKYVAKHLRSEHVLP